MKQLSKEEMKKVMGGVFDDGGGDQTGNCGVKIDGEWIQIYSDGFGAPTKPHAKKLFENGTATNWCCTQCPWN